MATKTKRRPKRKRPARKPVAKPKAKTRKKKTEVRKQPARPSRTPPPGRHKIPSSYSLATDVVAAIDEIAETRGQSKTTVVESAIRNEAKNLRNGQ
jgi:hypothetical protein